MNERQSPVPRPRGGAGVVAHGKRTPPAKPANDVNRVKAPAPMGDVSTQWVAHTLHIDVDNMIARKRAAFFRRLALFIGLPTVFMGIYAGFIATPRYVSEFQIIYKSNDVSTSTTSSALSSLMGTSGAPDMNRVLSTFLVSDAALRFADQKIGLREKFSDPKIDWWNRMPKDASQEKFLAYFQSRISVYEQTGGFLTVDVDGFDREGAKTFADTLIAAAAAMVNDITDLPRQDMLSYTYTEMKRYEDSLHQATNAITDYRNKYFDYDFSSTVSRLGDVVGNLQSQLAQARSDLTYTKTFLGEAAPTVMTLNSRIAALENQVKAEQNRLGSSNQLVAQNGVPTKPTTRAGEPYSKIVADYTELLQNQEFAKSAYVASKQAYEAARLEAAKKQGYVVSFVPPTLPQQSTEPDPARYIGTTFAASLILYVIGSLLIGLLRDQTGV
jgi:capsular polysaccharide transport system permease protein